MKQPFMSKAALRHAVQDLQTQLDNVTAQGVHSCSDTCARPLCVLRRQVAELTKDKERLDKLQRIADGATIYKEGVMICTRYVGGAMLINPRNLRAGIDLLTYPVPDMVKCADEQCTKYRNDNGGCMCCGAPCL